MLIYFDNAATTYPKPQGVINAVNRALREFGGNPGRSGHKMSIKAAAEIYKCRTAAAKLFGVENTENIIFMLNCTAACNTVLKGLLKSGDHVVVSPLEHNAVMRPLHMLSKAGITYTVADIDEWDSESIIEGFRNAIKPNTKLIVCTHASNVWGIRMPVERLTALAHIYQIPIMVDAAQSAGTLPIDLSQSKIDYLCVAGHKGLYGPMGTGMLITSAPQSISSLTQGGTGSSSMSFEQPDYPPDKFESGTPNLPGISGLCAGIDMVNKKGLKYIHQKETYLFKRMYNNLSNMPKIKLYTPQLDTEKNVPVISFNTDGISSEQMAAILSDRGVYVRGGLHCAPLAHIKMGTQDTGTVRLSPSIFSTAEEVERVSKIISDISKRGIYN